MRALLKRFGRAAAAIAGPNAPPSREPALSHRGVSPAGDWRAASHESAELREAVTRMEEHADMLGQLADAWLLAANLHARDEDEFIRNLRIAGELAHSIEWEAAAMVSELRQLANDADQRPSEEQRLRVVQAFIEWAHAQDALLHQRLRQVAASAELDSGDLRAVSRQQTPGVSVAEAESLLPLFQQSPRPTLRLCLE